VQPKQQPSEAPACACVLQDQPILAVGSLDGVLRFYTNGGAPKYKERKLEGGCLSLAYFNAEYLVISTTDK
jgi:hypothetical protein